MFEKQIVSKTFPTICFKLFPILFTEFCRHEENATKMLEFPNLEANMATYEMIRYRRFRTLLRSKCFVSQIAR